MASWESDHGDEIAVNKWGHVRVDDETGSAVYVFPSAEQVEEFIGELAAAHGLGPVNPAGSGEHNEQGEGNGNHPSRG